ncbi:hypothetical protein [Ralstonia solanacearum]|uniref:hypothetical protein n=1 Tax=Ralstonia solanacearum TaxID=305 RepID=UPI001E4F0D4B|nr:hypothetical protein [Ralstonia solanacearum]
MSTEDEAETEGMAALARKRHETGLRGGFLKGTTGANREGMDTTAAGQGGRGDRRVMR